MHKICAQWILPIIGVLEIQSGNRRPNRLCRDSKSGRVWEEVSRTKFAGAQGDLTKCQVLHLRKVLPTTQGSQDDSGVCEVPSVWHQLNALRSELLFYHFLPPRNVYLIISTSLTYYFELILDSHESHKNSTEDFLISLTLLPLTSTAYTTAVWLSKTGNEHWCNIISWKIGLLQMSLFFWPEINLGSHIAFHCRVSLVSCGCSSVLPISQDLDTFEECLSFCGMSLCLGLSAVFSWLEWAHIFGANMQGKFCCVSSQCIRFVIASVSKVRMLRLTGGYTAGEWQDSDVKMGRIWLCHWLPLYRARLGDVWKWILWKPEWKAFGCRTHELGLCSQRLGNYEKIFSKAVRCQKQCLGEINLTAV